MGDSFEQLVVWQKSMEMVTAVYAATKLFPKEEIFGLTSQLRRSALSVPSNIAEGKGRLTRKEYLHFLGTARGSLAEAATQIRVAGNLKYLEPVRVTELLNMTNEVGRVLSGLIAAIGRRPSSKHLAPSS